MSTTLNKSRLQGRSAPGRPTGRPSLKRYMPVPNSACFRAAAIAIALLVLPTKGMGCQYGSNSDELQYALQARAEMRVLVSEYAESADTIFVGNFNKLSDRTASFKDIVLLKGQASEADVFEWSRQTSTWEGCDGRVDFMNVRLESYDGRFSSYLVYANEKHILRVNKVGSFAESLNGYEEVEWLKE